MDDSFEISEFKKRFPFPAKLDIDECKKRTEEFARMRLHYLVWRESEEGFDPFLDNFVKTYPLPVDFESIIFWCTDNNIDYGKHRENIKPLIETLDNYIGYAKRFQNNKTVGWFLGLVEPFDYFHMSVRLRDQISEKDHAYLFQNMHYRFIEGMILLEGKIEDSESVLNDMRNFKIDYDRNILGKIITGRRYSYDSEFYVSEAKKLLKKNPKLKQKFLVPQIGRSLRTFQMDVRNEGYKDFRDLKADVLKK